MHNVISILGWLPVYSGGPEPGPVDRLLELQVLIPPASPVRGVYHRHSFIFAFVLHSSLGGQFHETRNLGFIVVPWQTRDTRFREQHPDRSRGLSLELPIPSPVQITLEGT